MGSHDNFYRTYIPGDSVRIDGRRGRVVKMLHNSPKASDNMRVQVRFVDGKVSVCEYTFGRRETIFVVDPLDLLAEI